MTRAARHRAHTIGLVLVAAVVGAFASNIVMTAREQTGHVAQDIYLCEGSLPECELYVRAQSILWVFVRDYEARP